MKGKTIDRSASAILSLIGLIFMAVLCGSCSDYLDAKPDQSLAIPDRLRDLQALLDNENNMNTNYPSSGEIASDYYYLSDADFNARSEDVRETYVWDPEAMHEQWLPNYSRILITNIVLDAVDQAILDGMNEVDRKRIKGAAAFFRGFTSLLLSQLYAPPYQASQARSLPGIPMKLQADISQKTTRHSLEETYQQILSDLRLAASLLPASTTTPTRPAKPAAYAALARTCLIMGDYDQAYRFADTCLKLNGNLMDYRLLQADAAIPIEVFNSETLLYAVLNGTSGVFNQTRAKVDPGLFALYDDNDLRKSVFFVKNSDQSIGFKGNYAGRAPSLPFCGLTTSEIYLVKAECAARLGNVGESAQTLKLLLEKRYEGNSFELPVESDSNALLDRILLERKKELLFRGGIYWSDIRRLNLDAKTARTMSRVINNTTYTLGPGDPHFTFLIPFDVVSETGIEQNRR